MGVFTIGDYVDGSLPPDDWNTYGTNKYYARTMFRRHAAMLITARKRGVIFSSFPTYVKATDLTRGGGGVVGYGRDAVEAYHALKGAYTVSFYERIILKLQREAVWGEFSARQARPKS